jgi:hypothetical protein
MAEANRGGVAQGHGRTLRWYQLLVKHFNPGHGRLDGLAIANNFHFLALVEDAALNLREAVPAQGTQ